MKPGAGIYISVYFSMYIYIGNKTKLNHFRVNK